MATSNPPFDRNKLLNPDIRGPNILFETEQSYSRHVEGNHDFPHIRLIDFGLGESLSRYRRSRSNLTAQPACFEEEFQIPRQMYIPYQPPEFTLKVEHGTKVDIWMLGRPVSRFITSSRFPAYQVPLIPSWQ